MNLELSNEAKEIEKEEWHIKFMEIVKNGNISEKEK